MKLTDTFHVSQKAWAIQGSKMFVDIDSDVKVEDLIRGMIIQSGNDACVVVAEGLAGSEEAFAERMNEKAKEIGLTGSNFRNSTGWPDPNHYMTAKDIAVLVTRLIRDFPEYYHYFAEKEFTWHGIKQGNRNPLLYRTGSGVDGLKTGHTEEAGFGLTASAVRDGRRIVMVVHGLTGMQERADEAGQLLDWAFRETGNYTVATKGAVLAEAPVEYGETKTVPLTVAQDLVLTLPKADREKVTAKAVVNDADRGADRRRAGARQADRDRRRTCRSSPIRWSPRRTCRRSASAAASWSTSAAWCSASRNRSRNEQGARRDGPTLHRLRGRRGRRQVDPGPAPCRCLARARRGRGDHDARARRLARRGSDPQPAGVRRHRALVAGDRSVADQRCARRSSRPHHPPGARQGASG